MPGIRIDTGFREGDTITYYYDPMIAKVIAHGANREAALDSMTTALDRFRSTDRKPILVFCASFWSIRNSALATPLRVSSIPI